MSFAGGELLISGNVNEDRLKASIYFVALLREIPSRLAVCALLKVSTTHMRKSFRIVDVESEGCGMNGSFQGEKSSLDSIGSGYAIP